jgi:hypothetical protein
MITYRVSPGPVASLIGIGAILLGGYEGYQCADKINEYFHVAPKIVRGVIDILGVSGGAALLGQVGSAIGSFLFGGRIERISEKGIETIFNK